MSRRVLSLTGSLVQTEKVRASPKRIFRLSSLKLAIRPPRFRVGSLFAAAGRKNSSDWIYALHAADVRLRANAGRAEEEASLVAASASARRCSCVIASRTQT